jgi:hypothetical protein
MVSNNDYKTFEVICDSEDIILKAIYIYNNTYNKDFKLIEYILDEVNFAVIGGNVSTSDIFDLGCLYARLTIDITSL